MNKDEMDYEESLYEKEGEEEESYDDSAYERMQLSGGYDSVDRSYDHLDTPLGWD